MGKWVIVEDIACNQFFKQFDNCLVYTSPEGFSAALMHALYMEPKPMDDEALRWGLGLHVLFGGWGSGVLTVECSPGGCCALARFLRAELEQATSKLAPNQRSANQQPQTNNPEPTPPNRHP